MVRSVEPLSTHHHFIAATQALDRPGDVAFLVEVMIVAEIFIRSLAPRGLNGRQP